MEGPPWAGDPSRHLGSKLEPAREAPSSEGKVHGWGVGCPGSARCKQTLSQVPAYMVAALQAAMGRGPLEG